jgi:hypothetical protein
MCTQDSYSKSTCQIATYGSSLGFYQHLTNANQGGASSYSDYCPLPSSSITSCKSSSSGSTTTGEVYGTSSACFKSNIVKLSISTSSLRCLSYVCDKTSGSYVIRITPNGATTR